MEITCPVCYQNDSIQKVSIIVANGHPSENTTGPTGGVAYNHGKWESVEEVTKISRSASIELAKKLSPPKEPIRKVGMGCKWILAIILLFISFAIFIAFATIVLRNLVHLNNSLSISSLNFGGFLPIILTIGISGLLFIILLIMGIDKLWENYNVNKLKEEEKFIKKKLRWVAAMNKWNSAYYCHRDGVVFDNKGITVCRLEEFKEFLFS